MVEIEFKRGRTILSAENVDIIIMINNDDPYTIDLVDNHQTVYLRREHIDELIELLKKAKEL